MAAIHKKETEVPLDQVKVTEEKEAHPAEQKMAEPKEPLTAESQEVREPAEESQEVEEIPEEVAEASPQVEDEPYVIDIPIDSPVETPVREHSPYSTPRHVRQAASDRFKRSLPAPGTPSIGEASISAEKKKKKEKFQSPDIRKPFAGSNRSIITNIARSSKQSHLSQAQRY